MNLYKFVFVGNVGGGEWSSELGVMYWVYLLD